jgi:7 transmembrane receptor (rhodopsin family)
MTSCYNLTNDFMDTKIVCYNDTMEDEQWPVERIVSLVVPFCFGIIGLAGLLGNALVVMGKCLSLYAFGISRFTHLKIELFISKLNGLSSHQNVLSLYYMPSYIVVASIKHLAESNYVKINFPETKAFRFSLSLSHTYSVVAANPSMRSTTNLLIINLAVSDLLFVVFCVPFTGADYTLDSWPFGDFWCRFVSNYYFFKKFLSQIYC